MYLDVVAVRPPCGARCRWASLVLGKLRFAFATVFMLGTHVAASWASRPPGLSGRAEHDCLNDFSSSSLDRAA
ncbi:hypothetical protein GGR56DRAFT_84761 [Xylariaceae sp. FL0804]|nr:hypothetical protein GGR56DRAFT_84761 [Xylariaceae sp. FL0804]